MRNICWLSGFVLAGFSFADLLSSLPVNIFIVTTIRGQEAFSATFHAKQQQNTGGSGTKHADLYSG